MKTYSDPHSTLRQLADSESPESLTALEKAAEDADEFIRRTAIETIGCHRSGLLLKSVILAAIKDPSAYVVRTACDVVAQWKLSEAHELVVALLTDASPATRQCAIRSLNEIWADADFPIVFQIYGTDSNTSARKEAAFALRKHTTSQCWRPLFDRFCVDQLPRHRQWACELAEAFGTLSVLSLLTPLLDDPDGHVRKSAANAIAGLKDRQLAEQQP